MQTCANCQLGFQITDEDQAFYAKMGVPAPELCPRDIWQQLMATRNEWKLYQRTCDATGENILSAYAPDSPFTVYKNDVWWGDSWDPLSFGRAFDFNRPFFEQFAELQKVVPREGTSIFNSENCDYNSHTRESKNCYLNSLMYRCEDVLYSYWMVNDKDVVDSLYAYDSTLCYDCSFIRNCYNCVLVEESVDSHDSYFSYELRSCDHCIFSNNLSHKSYYAFNKPCSKEEFEALQKKYLSGSRAAWEEARQLFEDMRNNALHRAVKNLRCEDVLGDRMYNSKNCTNCFDGDESEDCRNSLSLDNSKDIFNCYSAGWPGCEMMYRSAVSRGSRECAFCTYTWFSQNVWYCDSVISSKNSFGCIGIRHKEYCILNKQYSQAEYEALLPRIIAHMQQTGEWGMFFPPQLSTFAYDETAAQEYFPLEEADALSRGYRWRGETQRPMGIAYDLPDNTADISDDILSEVLSCDTCNRQYKVIAAEMRLYRRMGIPVPRSCPQCRHARRLAYTNPFHLWERPCANCGMTMQTSYAPDRPETVYCEKCYLETVY